MHAGPAVRAGPAVHAGPAVRAAPAVHAAPAVLACNAWIGPPFAPQAPACLQASAKAALPLTGTALPGAAPPAIALTAIALMTAALTEAAETGHQGCWFLALPLVPSSVQLLVSVCETRSLLEAPAVAETGWGMHWGVH